MARHAWSQEREFGSIYIGGGTPTIFAGEKLASLISSCRSLFRFVNSPEITVEANPNTITEKKLRLLKQAGVTRLSMGVQSFSDSLLTVLGRTHSRAEAGRAILAARNAGFENLSLDLMYGLPGQDARRLEQTLAAALEFHPEHISIYELTIEAGTQFESRVNSGELQLPGEELIGGMDDIIQGTLQENGYCRYEISNYSLPGRESRHNINYWKNGSYLGLGAGAVSCFSGLRIRNLEDAGEYARLVIKGELPFREGEFLSCAARFRESVVMGLRMLEGICFEEIEARFGISVLKHYGKVLDDLLEGGALEISSGRMRLTGRGLQVADSIMAMLV